MYEPIGDVHFWHILFQGYRAELCAFCFSSPQICTFCPSLPRKKPWEIYDKIQNTSNHELDQVGFSANVAADLSIPVSLRSYGATFIALDTGSVNSDKYGSLNIELGENMYAVAMGIFGDNYSSITSKESGTLLSHVSLSPKCLLMIVDESGKNHSDQIKITLNEIQGTDAPLPFRDDDDIIITDVPSVSSPR